MAEDRKIVEVRVGEAVLSTRGFRHIEYRNSEQVYVEGDINSLVSNLQKLRTKYQKQYTDLRLTATRDCGCYRDCYCSPSYYLHGKRLENDVEYEERMRLDKERQDREREQYERLRKQYEK